MISFSLDIDWASEEVIKDSIQFFEFYKVKCTLFATHDSEVIRNCNRDIFEVAIHPNFNFLLDGTETEKTSELIIEELLEIYPEAKGVRSHSMTQSSRLLSQFKQKGLTYDSNQFFPYNWDVKPYVCWTGLKRVPYNWEDDIHFTYNKSFKFDFDKVYNPYKNYVFDFHPIHIFLNTDSKETYEKSKINYHNPIKLKEDRDLSIEGVRNYLIDLLEFVKSKKIVCKKLVEL